MPTLAPKLPWQHPFAGGYPGRGGQPLPTDPDAIDYLNRVAAADGGAAVEVGIAQAIDAFVRGCKADSAGYAGDPTRTNWDAIQASCVMCGARTLSGALVPLKGTAPTAFGSWASGDYSRSGSTPGLKGDGTTKYIDTNRAGNADGQNDHHLAVHFGSAYSTASGCFAGSRSASQIGNQLTYDSAAYFISASRAQNAGAVATLNGLYGLSREQASGFDFRYNGSTAFASLASTAVTSENVFVFNRPVSALFSNARLAFYSLGSALDLAALDERVTNLVTAIRFHTLTGLLPNDYDPATIAYITAAYAAGGTL